MSISFIFGSEFCCLMIFLATIAGLFSYLKFLVALGYQLDFVGSLHFSFYRVEKIVFCLLWNMMKKA